MRCEQVRQNTMENIMMNSVQSTLNMFQSAEKYHPLYQINKL